VTFSNKRHIKNAIIYMIFCSDHKRGYWNSRWNAIKLQSS